MARSETQFPRPCPEQHINQEKLAFYLNLPRPVYLQNERLSLTGQDDRLVATLDFKWFSSHKSAFPEDLLAFRGKSLRSRRIERKTTVFLGTEEKNLTFLGCHQKCVSAQSRRHTKCAAKFTQPTEKADVSDIFKRTM